MDEDVLAVARWGNEAVALLRVEPFHRSHGHAFLLNLASHLLGDRTPRQAFDLPHPGQVPKRGVGTQAGLRRSLLAGGAAIMAAGPAAGLGRDGGAGTGAH